MGTSFKWTLQNKNKDMQKFRETTLFDLKNDEFDIWRETYNELLDDRISKGKQGSLRFFIRPKIIRKRWNIIEH